MQTLFLILLPLVGTTLGAAAVYPGRQKSVPDRQKALSGFAAGVMTAASVWSLLIPAIERSAGLPVPVCVPALTGLWAVFLFLYFLEHLTDHFRSKGDASLLCFAVALHNLPEGMAVGAAIAAWHSDGLSFASVLALTLGIAIQNLPEGAIISLPLAAQGTTRHKALGAGFLSGVIEPIGAVLTLIFAELALPVLPYMLSFSAGAMLYVTAQELISEASTTRRGVLWFAAGFSLMMTLDVMLG